MRTVVWFRHDLRLSDNPALSAAAECGTIVPVFWAPKEAGAFPPGAATKWWLHQSLAALQKSLRGALVIRQGRTLDSLRAVVKETGAAATILVVTLQTGRSRIFREILAATTIFGIKVRREFRERRGSR